MQAGSFCFFVITLTLNLQNYQLTEKLVVIYEGLVSFFIDENVDFLKAKIKELEIQQNELRLSIETKETEFGKKRAQLKDLFLQKESKYFYLLIISL